MKSYILIFLLSIIFTVICGFLFIPLIKKLKLKQTILKYVTEHNGKSGTPTMGGVIFILPITILFFIFAKKQNSLSFTSLIISLSYMLVGFIDDFIKVVLNRNLGLKAYQKIIFQVVIAIFTAIYMYVNYITYVYIPFTDKQFNLDWFIIPLVIFTQIAVVNGVNLTDGLDGLAGGVTYVYMILLSLTIFIQTKLFNSLFCVVEYENLILICLLTVGSLLGYLFFNTYKASVFMGDTGSLALGGLVSTLSMFSGNILYILTFGICYVISVISVVVQVIYYKCTGKRVFLMAPYHHHLQHKKLAESKICYIYKLTTLIFGLLSIIAIL